MNLILVMALVAAACTTATDTTTTTATAPETTAPAGAVTATTRMTDGTAEPDTDSNRTIDDHLAWLIGVLNGAEMTSDAYESRFAQVFKDQVSYGDVPSIVDQVTAGLTGWDVVDTETSGSTNLVVLIAPAGGEPVLRLLLNVDAERRIDGLFFQPGEPPVLDDPPESYAEAFDRLAALGGAAALVAETTDGQCTPVAEMLADQPVPLGSMFKVYVLGAVAGAVADGEVTWDEEVPLDSRNYSLPSGVTQNEDPGSALTVEELAQRMIQISDNTATDHLIALVGRDTVEVTQAEMGHSDPSLNIPFLTTRELFQLKLRGGDALAAFIDGDASARARVLDGLADEPLPDLSAAVGFTEPVAVLAAEWFASPRDLCEAWSYLADRALEPGLEPLSEIVGANPGIPDETGAWNQIWFKGGSEPGVLGMSWLLTTDDERSFVVAGSVFNESEAFDQTVAVLLFGAIRDLLAAEVPG